MRIASIVLRVLVGLVFVFQGIVKLSGAANDWRDDLQVAPWAWVAIGVIQLAGAIGLFASFRYQRLIVPSALYFVAVMIGAIIQHIRIDDPVSEMVFPAVLLLMSGAIAQIGARQSDDVRVPTGEQETDRVTG